MTQQTADEYRDLVITDPRRSGDVKRYHTWPVLRQQTIAHHTWNVIRVLMTLWPDTPASAFRYAMLHDAGEIGPGDLPYPTKHRNPAVKAEIDRMENATLVGQGWDPLSLQEDLLNETEDGCLWKARIKVCDMIEMLEFGLEEVELGNRLGIPVVWQMRSFLEKYAEDMFESASDRGRIARYVEARITLHHEIMAQEV